MDSEAEVERIRLFTAAARQRIRRLDVLLDEQVRILALDPSLSGKTFYRRNKGHLITRLDLQVFAALFLLASLGSFLAGFWTAHFR
jgi:hypothetical protein